MLSKKEKRKIEKKKTIATIPITYDVGIFIQDILYGIDDYAEVMVGTNVKHSIHRVKIYYDKNGAYIRLFNSTFRFNEATLCNY